MQNVTNEEVAATNRDEALAINDDDGEFCEASDNLQGALDAWKRESDTPTTCVQERLYALYHLESMSREMQSVASNIASCADAAMSILDAP